MIKTFTTFDSHNFARPGLPVMILLGTHVNGSFIWNLVFGSLGFVWNLVFGAWKFHKLPVLI